MPKSNFPPSKKMGAVIASERKAAGIKTQKQLAERIGYEINDKHISFVENGKQGLSNRSAKKLMNLFECDEFYLRGESPYKTEEERRIAEYSRGYQKAHEKFQAVLNAMSSILEWNKLGTVGMCTNPDNKFPRPGVPEDYLPYAADNSGVHDVPDNYVYHPHYYIFDTPQGKRAVTCMDFVQFSERVFSFMEMELKSMAEFTPALSGWEFYIPSEDGFCTFTEGGVIRFFDNFSRSGFCYPPLEPELQEWLSNINQEQDETSNRQQDNEKKGEEQ